MSRILYKKATPNSISISALQAKLNTEREKYDFKTLYIAAEDVLEIGKYPRTDSEDDIIVINFRVKKDVYDETSHPV